MHDRDVRAALHERVLAVHRGDPDTIVLDELGLQWGAVRVDVAVVNGQIHGYEIKSDADTLARLPAQEAIYSRILDRATLVSGTCHIDQAVKIVPEWWELVAVEDAGAGVEFTTLRSGGVNPAIDPEALASLLWRDEALAILEDVGAATGFRSKPRRALYRHLADILTVGDLSSRVRRALKQRTGWRAAAPRS